MKHLVAWIFLFASMDLASPARAEDAPEAPPPSETVAPASLPPPALAPAAPALSAAATAPALNFDMFADDKEVKRGGAEADQVAASANVRRSRLRVHQTLGITTWGLMAATAVVGQLNYNDVYGSGGGRTGHYLMPHRLLGYATAISFTVAAAYALFAPTPYKRPLKLDTALVHRIAVVGAALGMVAQVALGFYTARKADAGNPDGLASDARTHLAIGYATLGMMTIAGASWVF